MKWAHIGKEKGWIDTPVDNDLIFYHQILTERKTIDQPSRDVLAFLTILIKKNA